VTTCNVSRPTEGAADLRPAAIGALIALLAVVTVWARLADEGAWGAALPRPPAPEPRLCAGVEVDGKLLGLAFGNGWGELAAAAAADLGLPARCAPLLAAHRERGALVRFDTGGKGDCRRAGVAVLPAPARLLCGAGLDVNRDSARDLELLPGVGPVKAGALVESRERDGPFLLRTDLERVRGIGPRTVEGLALWLDGIDQDQ
jgi:competence ComEA-like helix-hairpin-helix protein